MTNTPTADIEHYVQEKLATGEFSSREELATEAIRVYRELEARHAQLKSDVQTRIEQADRGEVGPLDIDDIKQELIDELDGQGHSR